MTKKGPERRNTAGGNGSSKMETGLADSSEHERSVDSRGNKKLMWRKRAQGRGTVCEHPVIA